MKTIRRRASRPVELPRVRPLRGLVAAGESAEAQVAIELAASLTWPAGSTLVVLTAVHELPRVAGERFPVRPLDAEAVTQHVTRQAERSMPDGAASSQLRAGALTVAGKLATWQADFVSARRLIEESLAIYRAIDDRPGTAEALNTLGWAVALADGGKGLAAFDNSVEIFGQLGNDRAVAEGLDGSGWIAARLGDLVGARLRLEASVRGFRRIGDRHGLPFALADLGRLEQPEGDPGKASAL